NLPSIPLVIFPTDRHSLFIIRITIHIMCHIVVLGNLKYVHILPSVVPYGVKFQSTTRPTRHTRYFDNQQATSFSQNMLKGSGFSAAPEPIIYFLLQTATHLLLSQSNQTFGDLSTNGPVGPGGGVSTQLNTELRSDFVLHLVQSLSRTGNQQLVVVALAVVLLLRHPRFHLLADGTLILL